MLEGLMVLIAIAALVVTFCSDAGSIKKKNPNYFRTVQKPTKKTVRELPMPDLSEHDGFFSKLNAL